MDNYKFTKKADNDIDNIHEYTVLNFGFKQAQKYSQNLFNKIESIASKDIQGRKADFIKKGLRKLKSRFTYDQI